MFGHIKDRIHKTTTDEELTLAKNAKNAEMGRIRN